MPDDPQHKPTPLDAACALSPADPQERRVAVALRLAADAPRLRAALQDIAGASPHLVGSGPRAVEYDRLRRVAQKALANG